MDDRPVVWDAANRKHLAEDHPERGIEVHLADRDAYQVIGQTARGRWLVVIWIDQREGRYRIHARAASRRIIRRVTGG